MPVTYPPDNLTDLFHQGRLKCREEMMFHVIVGVSVMELNERHEPIGRVPVIGRSDLHFVPRLLHVVLFDVHFSIQKLVCVLMVVVEQRECTVRVGDRVTAEQDDRVRPTVEMRGIPHLSDQDRACKKMPHHLIPVAHKLSIHNHPPGSHEDPEGQILRDQYPEIEMLVPVP